MRLGPGITPSQKREFVTLNSSPEGAPDIDASTLTRILHPYRRSNPLRSVLELAATAVPLAALWIVAWIAVRHGFWWGALLSIPAAGFLVRLFGVQHDCGHGSFFQNKHANDWVGRVISVFTLTPYDDWRNGHAAHHATSGDLDRRGVGDIDTLTVEEYLALPPMRRFGYRLFRHPAIMFLLGPFFVFLFRYRLPVGPMGAWRSWFSTMTTNLAIVVVVGVLIRVVGLRPFLLVVAPTVMMASAAGVWLFYIQHQFEGVYWARSDDWSLREAALHGSSHYHLPRWLAWFTADIGLHHVHHLSSRIPFYRLRQVLRDHPELDIRRLTLAQSLRGAQLALWDEANRRLISFREARLAYGI